MLEREGPVGLTGGCEGILEHQDFRSEEHARSDITEQVFTSMIREPPASHLNEPVDC